MAPKPRKLSALFLTALLAVTAGCHDTALQVLDAVILSAEIAEMWLLEF